MWNLFMYIFCDWSFQPKRRASPKVLMQEYSWNIWGKAGKLMWLVKGEQKKSIKERSDKDKWELDPMESHWPSKGLHMLSKMRIFCSVWLILKTTLCSYDADGETEAQISLLVKDQRQWTLMTVSTRNPNDSSSRMKNGVWLTNFGEEESADLRNECQLLEKASRVIFFL